MQATDTKREIRPLQMIFSDVVGPIIKPCVGGSHYFVTLMDDPSGYLLVKFLRKKSQAPDSVKCMISEMGSS